MHWSDRIERVQPFRVMHLLELAQAREAAGHDVIHLEVGEPDFATPQPVVEAGQRALLEEENVAITPKIDFAVRGGEHHVRIAFTNDVARLEEALHRFERFLARQTGA